MNPILQNRWKIERHAIVYYGLRKKPNTFHNVIRLRKSTLRALSRMDGNAPLELFTMTPQLKRLIKQGIVTDVADRQTTPETLENARFCKRCAANDYTILGLELDEEGLCPLCADQRNRENLKAVMPVVSNIPHNKKGDYDAAVFYTGGKDSSFLLYYLVKVRGLRVLALTWKTPYMSCNALQNIENARRNLPETEFIVQEIEPQILNKIYAEHFRLVGNTCMCPSLAYILFYPLLVGKRIPYLVLGNEPAQMINLIYNRIAPKIAFRPWAQKLGLIGVNIGRVVMLRRPITNGQMQMLATVGTLAFGTRWGKKKDGAFQNEQVQNVCRALQVAPELLLPFRAGLRQTKSRGFVPRLVHVDFDAVCGEGGYRWNDVKSLLKKELEWADSPETGKGLHTSCQIERCKEYTQMTAFRQMRSRTIPYSAIELALAVQQGCLSREEALEELKNHSGFTEERPAEYETMVEVFKR